MSESSNLNYNYISTTYNRPSIYGSGDKIYIATLSYTENKTFLKVSGFENETDYENNYEVKRYL